MPWKASSVMEERLRLAARLLDEKAMTEVCRHCGISRKTARLDEAGIRLARSYTANSCGPCRRLSARSNPSTSAAATLGDF
jgi:hypothetical protein